MSLDGRRRFLAGVGALLVATCAGAEQPLPRIGILASSSPAAAAANHRAFFDALAQRGWVEGENVTVDRRFADGVPERLAVLAAELIALEPRLVVAPTEPGVAAVRSLTRSIPIVFMAVPDPVGAGFAKSLANPGGNATGLATVNVALGPKRLALLKEAFPETTRVALLYNPEVEFNRRLATHVEPAAQNLGLEVVRVAIGGPATFDTALGMLDAAGPEAIYVVESPQLHTHRRSLVARISERRLPAMYGLQVFVVEGGLMAYAVSIPEQFRRAADYVDRILRGAAPGDLPIQQPTKFELVVNRKAAAALDQAIAPSVLLRADRLID